MKTGRMEAFSDGVIAIIITIMVLELPRPEGHEWSFLIKLWPTLLGYILSFIYVGIYWNNHHHLLSATRRVSGNMLWANLHLLFWLSLFPYVTGWAGESHFAPVPMTCYAFIALMCGVAYTILLRSIMNAGGNELVIKATGNAAKEKISMVYYLLGIILPLFGQWGAYASGLLMLGAALMWLIPNRRIERVLSEENAD